jgi:hypothetical protein
LITAALFEAPPYQVSSGLLKPWIRSEIAFATFGLARITVVPLREQFQGFLGGDFAGSVCQFQTIPSPKPQFLSTEHGS